MFGICVNALSVAKYKILIPKNECCNKHSFLVFTISLTISCEWILPSCGYFQGLRDFFTLKYLASFQKRRNFALENQRRAPAFNG